MSKVGNGKPRFTREVIKIFILYSGNSFLMQLLIGVPNKNMTEARLTLAIQKYLSGEATEEEKLQVEQWYESFDASSVAFAAGSSEAINDSTARSLQAIKEKIAQKRTANIEKEYPVKSGKRVIPWWHAAAAAAILILVSGITLSLLHKKTNRQQAGIAMSPSPVKKDFKPGGNKAILTLANGQKIVLDSSNNGMLFMQGNAKVVKINSGLLAYDAPQKTESKKQKAEIHYNTISTPRGGQYEVILSDGSKVWLNAASSIRFPTAFTGKDREVQMTGEAYFEIARNANQLFKVSVRGMMVNVLGTHFNIMAYNDEKTIKTTLLEGSLKVTEGNSALLLQPGQEAQLRQNGEIKLVKDVNVKEALAWKNNLFWFDNDDIQSVMRQLSRWYNVDMIIKGDIPDLFTGSIPRNISFSKVFEVLQKTGSIHYKIEDS
ncbi:MAG TPA: FecR family protein, partial [Chitinophagaceae bacterium]